MVRHKNRYIVVKISEMKSNKETFRPEPVSIQNAILGVVQYLYGDHGVGAIRSGLLSKYCNPLTRIAVIRSRHGPHKLVASAIPYIRYLHGEPVKMITLYMGATIRHCYKFIKNYQQKKLDELSTKVKTVEEKKRLEDAIMNLDPDLKMSFNKGQL